MSTTTTTTIVEQRSAPEVAPVQPDIGYHPDVEKYLARSKRRLAENPDLPNVALPPGFPQRVGGPIVWKGADWRGEEQWVYRLDGSELKEIDDALQHFKGVPVRSLCAKYYGII